MPLFDLYNGDVSIQESQVPKFFIDIADAVQYLHSINIVHLNLRPDFMFLDQNDRAKLGGFQYSHYIEHLINWSIILREQ